MQQELSAAEFFRGCGWPFQHS